MDDNLSTNITTAWGVPVHPLGKISIYKFISEAETRDLVQRRFHGFQTFLLASLLTFLITICNLRLALKIVIRQRRSFAGWCCVSLTVIGLVPGIATFLTGVADMLNCAQIGWLDLFAVYTSTLLNNVIVLQRAYLSQCRQLWVLLVSIVMLLPNIFFIIVAVGFSYTTIDNAGTCVFHHPPIMPVLWFSSSIPANLFFGGIFVTVAYKQYRMFGTDAWKRLAKDGIQAMCLVTLCNICCVMCIVTKVGGSFTDLFYMADWLICSTILVRNCDNMRSTVNTIASHNSNSNRLKTSRIDIKETITTYHGHIATHTEFTSFY